MSSADEPQLCYGVKIYKLGDPELKVRCSEVTLDEILNSTIVQEAKASAHTALRNFRKIEGFGRAIAAPQVGSLIRMIAMNLDGKEITLFNPVVTHHSTETFTMWDDCLSFPDLMVCVERNRHISVEFIDDQGLTVCWDNCESDISELLQHEIDHLDGVLAVDRAVKPPKMTSNDAELSRGVVNREDWLANKPMYNEMVDFSY